MTFDDWNISKMTDEELIKTLRNSLACREVEIVASKEALARIMERMQVHKVKVATKKPDTIKDGNLFIQPFEWDKGSEKSFNRITFFERDDGRVMIFYMNIRIFTTRDKIMQIPFPVPYGYPLLKDLNGNKRTAVREYRKYLAVGLSEESKNEEDCEKPEKPIARNVPYVSMEKALELKEKRKQEKK